MGTISKLVGGLGMSFFIPATRLRFPSSLGVQTSNLCKYFIARQRVFLDAVIGWALCFSNEVRGRKGQLLNTNDICTMSDFMLKGVRSKSSQILIALRAVFGRAPRLIALDGEALVALRYVCCIRTA